MKKVFAIILLLIPSICFAQSTTVTSTTCGGTDKVSAITSTGAVTCSTDQPTASVRYDQIDDAGTHSGLVFSTFSNSWTSTAATTDFFTISANSLSSGDAATIAVDSDNLTNGHAFQVLGGSAATTPLLTVQDSITNGVGIGLSDPSALLELGTAAGAGVTATRLTNTAFSQPITTAGPSDMFGVINSGSGVVSGMQVLGFSDQAAETGLILIGTIGSTTPTAAAIVLSGMKFDGGTDQTNLADTEKLLQLARFSTNPSVTVLGRGNMGIRNTAPTAELDVTGQVKAESWGGTSTGHSGINFSSFTNVWTYSGTTTDFFSIDANSLTTADAVNINVAATNTTGDALEINRGGTKVAGVDGFGQLSVGSFGGTMNGNSGINFSTFSNSWTYSGTNSFFTANANSVTGNNAYRFSTGGITTGTGFVILAGNNLTTGKAFQVMGGVNSTFPVFVVDATRVGIGRSVLDEAQFEVYQQAGLSNEGIALSDGNVSHGFTGIFDGDNYGYFRENSTTAGGVELSGIMETNAISLALEGHVGSASPTVAAVNIEGWKSDGGTGRVGTGTTEKILQIRSGSTDVFTVLGRGNVGILTTAPAAELEVNGQLRAESWSGVSTGNSGIDFGSFTNSWTSTLAGAFFDILGADNSTIMTLKINATQANVTGADAFIDFRSTDGSEGSIAGTAAAGVIAYNTFTGSHYSQIDERDGLEPGILLEATGEVLGDPYFHLSKARISLTRKSKAAYGVWGGVNKDNLDMVLSIGSGVIWVVNKGKNLEAGDYLMSSDVRGHAEKQNDELYHNYTVGKIMESVEWLPGEKRRKVACILLGG